MSTSLRQVLRRSAKSPGFSLLIVVTLAFGLGASSAIFSIVNTVLLNPLPYPESEHLVMLDHSAPGLDIERMDISEALFLFYREHAKSFEAVSLASQTVVTLTGPDQPQRLQSASLTPGTLAMLGITPLFGRPLMEEEETPGAPGVVLLSEGLWRTQFGAHESVLGTVVEIDGVRREVVGVMPRGFAFPRADIDLWLPYTLDPSTARLGNFESMAVARLTPGTTMAQAHAELDHFLTQLSVLFPEDQAAPILEESDFRANPRSLRDEVVGDVETSLWLLFGSVIFVLLIACANVANLFLVRAEGRQRETAIRTAMGAGRKQHLHASLLETGFLVGLAAALGLGICHLGLEFLHRLGPGELPRLSEIAIDGKVLAFHVALALLSISLFALLPLAFSKIPNLSSVLKEGGRSTTGSKNRLYLRRWLVAGQVALALVLLVGAGLMIRSFQNLSQVDPGFRIDQGLTFRLALPNSKFQDDLAAANFWMTLQQKLESLPGVHSAAASSSAPLAGTMRRTGHMLQDRQEEEGGLPLVFAFETITGGYIKTAGLRLLEGRPLNRADAEHRSASVLVNERLALQNWPHESALGKRLDPGSALDDPWYTVVGVVANVRAGDLATEAEPTVYYPLLAKEENGWIPNGMDVVLHYSGDRDALMSAVRRTVWAMDANLPIANVRTFEQLVADSRSRHAFTFTLLLIASCMALALSALGTYGIIAYLVAQRNAEIGIRLALGARGAQVAALVLREGFFVAAVGILLGLLGAFGLTRWLEALLFEVNPLDPLTFALVPVLLLVAAFLACWLPARRAARIDPLVALRHD